jgi:hypothetical protein
MAWFVPQGWFERAADAATSLDRAIEVPAAHYPFAELPFSVANNDTVEVDVAAMKE